MQVTRESIFVGAIRAFCTGFAGLLGVFVAITIGVIVLFSMSSTSYLPAQSEATIEPDAQGNRAMLPHTDPVIIKIKLSGIIGDGGLTGSSLRTLLLDSREGMFAGNRVKGIFLYIDTPGGTVTSADDIYRLLLDYKKKHQVPVYAYVDGLCASGGMYIASACDKILSAPTSTIGSVGVIFGPTFNVSQAMEKLGVQSHTLTEGKDKDMFNPFRAWVPGEDQSLRNIMTALYQRFVDVVTAGRPGIDKQKLVDVYGAQVYLAQEAKELGYIDDANSSYESAMAELAKASGIPETQSYQVFLLEKTESFLEQLIESKSPLFSGKITHRFEIGPYLNSDMSGKFLYLYQP